MENWGGYFEAIKNCLEAENKELTWQNFCETDKIFSNLQALEKTSNLTDFFKVKQSITKNDQDKLNSELLDILIKCDSFEDVVKEGNIDAVNFYFAREGNKDFVEDDSFTKGINTALLFGHKDIYEHLKMYEDFFEFAILSWDSSFIKRIIQTGDIESLKFIDKYGSITYNSFYFNYIFCQNFSDEIAEFILEKLIERKFKKQLTDMTFSIFTSPYMHSTYLNFLRKNYSRYREVGVLRGVKYAIDSYLLHGTITIELIVDGCQENIQDMNDYLLEEKAKNCTYREFIDFAKMLVQL